MNSQKPKVSRTQIAKIRKRRRRRRKVRACLLSLTLTLGCFAAVYLGIMKILPQISSSFLTLPSEGEINLSQIHSRYLLLENLESGQILAQRRSQEKFYPASLTKIMTAILTIENFPNLDEVLVIPENIVSQLYTQDASMAGFLSGEEVTVRDLLYGTLLPSGAECCLSLAERISGSEAGFAELMNQKASELGMKNTHFCNATGLHDTQHYSTAEDMAVLLRYALGNPEFYTVFIAASYSVPPTNLHPEGFTFSSTLFKDMGDIQIQGGEFLGGKTGYTEEAGLCLASLALVGGERYILVTAKADGTHETEPFHILDAAQIYGQLGK